MSTDGALTVDVSERVRRVLADEHLPLAARCATRGVYLVVELLETPL